MLEVARRSIAAVVAEMSGDLPGALAELEAAPLTLVPPAISTAVQHLVIHNLLLSGRADDAVAVARQLLDNRPDRLARYLSAIAGWMAGEPTELLALNRSTVDIPAVTSRDYFVRRTVVAAMLASTGQRDGVHRLVTGSSPVADATSNARDAVLDAVARALCAVVDHDDEAAAPLIVQVVATHADSPILDQHLRRFLPLVYVLDPSVRARWDEAPMGPTHEHARHASRCLVTCAPGTLDVGLRWIPARCSPPSRCPGRSSWPPSSTAPVRRTVSRSPSGWSTRFRSRRAPSFATSPAGAPGAARPPPTCWLAYQPHRLNRWRSPCSDPCRSPSAVCPQHLRHCDERGCAPCWPCWSSTAR